jgi:hypothetical protein
LDIVSKKSFRYDRDAYVTVNLANVAIGNERNFAMVCVYWKVSKA